MGKVTKVVKPFDIQPDLTRKELYSAKTKQESKPSERSDEQSEFDKMLQADILELRRKEEETRRRQGNLI